MTPPRLTTSARVAQIRAALVDVKRSRDEFFAVNADPTADTFRMGSARRMYEMSVSHFGWQWVDIEAVLDALAPPEGS